MFVDERMTVQPPTMAQVSARPNDAARATTLLEPGPSAVRALLGLIPSRMSAGGRIDALIGLDRQIAMLQAKQQEVLAEVVREDPDGELFSREEVACALRLAPGTAQQRLDVAAELTSRLWDTRELMFDGELSYVHARISPASGRCPHANAVQHLSDEVTAQVQATVLRRATGQTPGEFRASVRRAVARFDRRDEGQRHEDAFTDRRVVMTPDTDGMCDIYLRLAAEGAVTFMAGVNSLACVKIQGDDRTVDQRRADAAVEMAMAILNDPTLPKPGCTAVMG